MSVGKVNRVSGMDYLHEKAEESRHNETLAYLIFIAGAVFFVGGLLETILTSENPDWFFFFPYKPTPHVGGLLGLSLMLSGFTLLVLGTILSIHYALDRALYMDQLKEVYGNEKSKGLKIRAIDRGTKSLAKQPESRKVKELEECKRYLVNHMGLYEDDAVYYCKTLGGQWCELVNEDEPLCQ
ncbi:MAG: hypothetical protein ACE5J6_01100 [Candidatus Bathyarchaeia archaeon]